MYRFQIALCVGVVVTSLAFSRTFAQEYGRNDSSRRVDSGQIVIEQEDIYDLLAPLAQIELESVAEAEEVVIPSTTSDTANDDGSSLIELQPSTPTPAPTLPESANTARAEIASRRVQEILANQLASADLPPVLTSLSQDELRQLVIGSSSALNTELGSVHYGERWQSFLGLRQIPNLLFVASDTETPAGSVNSNHQQLQAILQSCDRVARDQQFQTISDRHNFAVLRFALAEYLAPTEQRPQRRAAQEDVAELIQALTSIPTGHQWLQYFETERVARLLSSPRPLSRDERGQLQLILARFEKAVVDPQYNALTKLPGFAQTHQRLQAVVAVVPDAEAAAMTSDEGPEAPVAESGRPAIVLSTDQGVVFTRKPEDAQWNYAERTVQLTSPSAVKTNEKGYARLVIGGDTQVVCSPNTVLQIRQFADSEGEFVTELTMFQGNLKLANRAVPDLSPRTDPSPVEERIAIVYKGHRIIPATHELELDLRQEPRTERVIASVYTGSIVVAHGSGDEVTIRVGREAVMLPAGIAIRAAAKKPERWWPTRDAAPENAFRSGAELNR